MRSPETRGERIRRLRKAAGLTQEECAKRAGFTKGLLSQWELDTVKNPGGQKLNSLARVLRSTSDDILHGEPRHADTRSSAETEEVQFLELFRHVPEALRPHLRRIVEALAKH